MSNLAPSCARGAVRALVLVVLSAGLSAQTRDPTRPPAPRPSATAAAAAVAAALPPAPLAVIVREGKPYVIVGTRLHAQGDRLGEFQIERIAESEVWLRQGSTVHRIPRFAGVQRVVLP